MFVHLSASLSRYSGMSIRLLFVTSASGDALLRLWGTGPTEQGREAAWSGQAEPNPCQSCSEEAFPPEFKTVTTTTKSLEKYRPALCQKENTQSPANCQVLGFEVSAGGSGALQPLGVERAHRRGSRPSAAATLARLPGTAPAPRGSTGPAPAPPTQPSPAGNGAFGEKRYTLS